MSLQKTFQKNRNKGIPYLPFIIVGCFLVGYLLYYTDNPFYYKLTLNPYKILKHGEVWRLFTWLFTIPYSLKGINALFMPINMFFFFFFCVNLEKIWGRLTFNFFIFGQILIVDLVSCLLGVYQYFFSYLKNISAYFDVKVDKLTIGDYNYVYNVTHYMCVSIFLAFAVIFTEQVVLLYMIIPVKMKWLAYLDLFFLAYDFIRYGDLQNRGVICSMVIHFALFYLLTRSLSGLPRAMRKRQRSFQDAVRQGNRLHGDQAHKKRASADWQYRDKSSKEQQQADKIIRLRPATNSLDGAPMHRCCICGRTEKDAPDLDFRYCSKCSGGKEYCADHLYTHEHQ